MKKILIVDDEKEIRDLIKERLTREKYAVMTAASGREALIICKTSPPDLVLLDIAMPEMDGYTACEKLRKDAKTRAIPVLFLTGKDLETGGIIERCQALGVEGHVSKLSTLKELTDKIREVLGLTVILLFLFSVLGPGISCFAANVTPAEIQRSEEIIDEEGAVRERAEKGAKVFIKEIEVTGANLIEEEQIKEAVFPSEGHWLYKSDIQAIIDSLTELYNKSGYGENLKDISYKVKGGLLQIKIEEK